jgi:predicted small metal-binding protein
VLTIKEDGMEKVLRCRDLVPDCNFEARGQTEEELLQKAARHAQQDHGMEVTPELAAAVRGAIKEE